MPTTEFEYWLDSITRLLRHRNVKLIRLDYKILEQLFDLSISVHEATDFLIRNHRDKIEDAIKY